MARQSGREEAECVRHLFQRLSILLVKGNAALFLNRQPHEHSPFVASLSHRVTSSDISPNRERVVGKTFFQTLFNIIYLHIFCFNCAFKVINIYIPIRE